MTSSSARRAQDLLERARTEPEAVDPQAFDRLLTAENPQVRRCAIDGLQYLARDRPRVLSDRSENIKSLLTDPDREVRASATDIIAERGNASIIAECVPILAGLVDDDFPIVRSNALTALVQAARIAPDTTRANIDAVVPVLSADDERERTDAAMFFATMSMADPESVAPVTDQLLSILESSASSPAADASRTPRAVQEHRARLRTASTALLRDRRQAAGRAICELARTAPAAVVSDVDMIAGVVQDPDPQLRTVGLETLCAIAEAFPARVAAVTDHIVTVFENDHEGTTVRAAACRTVATIGAHALDLVTVPPPEWIEAIKPVLDDEATRTAALQFLALAFAHDSTTLDPVWDSLSAADREQIRRTADTRFVD